MKVRRACDHRTAAWVRNQKVNGGVIVMMKCTWACQKSFYLFSTPTGKREIGMSEAIKMIEAKDG